MFLYHHIKVHNKKKHIMEIFDKTYEIHKNYKTSSKCDRIPLYFSKYKLGIFFGENPIKDKLMKEYQKMGIRIFRMPKHENVFVSSGRILNVLKSIDYYRNSHEGENPDNIIH